MATLEIKEETYELFKVLKYAYRKKENVVMSDDMFLRLLMQEFADSIKFKGFHYEDKRKGEVFVAHISFMS
jgi:hypothetical protein